jgi:hypothetical protein
VNVHPKRMEATPNADGAADADGGSAQAPTLSAFGFVMRDTGAISLPGPSDEQRSPVGP